MNNATFAGINRRIIHAPSSVLVAATTISVLGFLMFLPFAAREAVRFGLARISAWDWVALAYYGLVVTVLAFVLWARGLAVVPASTAAVFTAVLPLSAVLLSYAVLGEAFAWSHLLGGACVIGGIVLLAREPAEGGLSAGGVPVE